MGAELDTEAQPMAQRILLPFAALIAAALLGGVAAVGAWEALDDTEEATTPTTATGTPAAAQSRPSGSASVADVVEQALPSVVHVTVGDSDESDAEDEGPRVLPRVVPRLDPPLVPQRAGSGFLIDERHIVTNQHVVGPADNVTVRFHDGEEAQARVLGTDPSTDVALLELSEEHEDAAVLPLGSTESLRIGDPVIAIGSPFGLQGTVTTGIVSALDRDIRAPDGFTIDGAIQTDAALNQGNSGGPLLDGAGRVMGMNAQIATESGASSGVGYAIPIETVREIAAELERDGTVEHPYLGVMIEDAGEDGGARVGEVVDGGPADRAGLRANDVVIRAGDSDVASADELRRIVADAKPGDELELRVRRGDDERTITVELGRRPASTE
jgi:S1-C subfamily serine protease